MNKSILQLIAQCNNQHRRFLIMNERSYEELKKELGYDYYEDLVSYKGLTICISKLDSINYMVI
jgi:hypothetical protein